LLEPEVTYQIRLDLGSVGVIKSWSFIYCILW